MTPKNGKSAEDLNKVRKLYDQLEYVRAVDALKKFCITYSVKPDLTIRITNKSSDWVMPTMNKNYARRFYETRVAQLGIADIDLAKANKVSMAITGISAANLDDISTITLAAEARREKRFFDRMDKLTDLSYRYKKRIRTKKEGMMSTKREISNAITGESNTYKQ